MTGAGQRKKRGRKVLKPSLGTWVFGGAQWGGQDDTESLAVIAKVLEGGIALLWRWGERDIIPYCKKYGIAAVSYSSIAQGIFTGKSLEKPQFKEGDQRSFMSVHFEPEIWPHVYRAVEKLKGVAVRSGRALVHLAIRWVTAQPGITSVLVGARTWTPAVHFILTGLTHRYGPNKNDGINEGLLDSKPVCGLSSP